VIPPVEIIERIAEIIREGRERLGARLAVLVASSVRYGRAPRLGVWLEEAGIASKPFHERDEAIEWLRGG
jgi:hypothetical protein